ncbi:MAG: YbaN family protein [Rubrivivax sp.]|nr:YbaN family protein [Rubrivivax sp.]
MVRRVLGLLLWRLLAATSLLLGLVGVFVPGLPTVPFLLLAAWAGGKGWPALEAWLLAHPRHGPAIRRWRDHRAVPRRAKWLASATMLASAALVGLSSAPAWLKLGMLLLLACVATWLWRRPEL